MQGVARFPGISQVVSARYTRGLGTQPGVAILEVLPQAGNIPATGTITFLFGGNFVLVPGCRVDFGSMRFSAVNGRTVVIRMFDRRWAWQAGGAINGRYNVPVGNGSIDPETEKTPQELASLLLDAMGESNYSVSALPNGSRPYVSWDHSHPATELDRLCEMFGCRVCLRLLTNRVQIVRLGLGNLLPTAGLQTIQQNTDIAELPDSLQVVGAPVRFQSKLKLQAVGREADGTIKPIDDLSYAPTEGWGGDPTFADVADDEERQLAKEWVFRAYQIVSQADGTQDLPDFGDIEDINNIKPIDPYLIETYEDANGKIRFQPAYVEGEWFNADTQVNANTDPFTRYFGEFFIDREDGIVRFPVPVYKLNGVLREEADLYLICSYHALHPETGIPVRFERTRPLGGSAGTGPKVIWRPDIEYTIWGAYDGAELITPINNLSDVREEADTQMDAALAEFLTGQAFYAIYNGILPIDIDGLTRQVTFKVESEDFSPRGGAETLVSVNCEADPYVPRYGQKLVSRESIQRRTKLARKKRFPQSDAGEEDE